MMMKRITMQDHHITTLALLLFQYMIYIIIIIIIIIIIKQLYTYIPSLHYRHHHHHKVTTYIHISSHYYFHTSRDLVIDLNIILCTPRMGIRLSPMMMPPSTISLLPSPPLLLTSISTVSFSLSL